MLVGGAAGAELGDGAAVPGLGGELADPGGHGGVLEGAGQAVGDPVQPGDGVVGEQRVVPAGEGEVVAQVGGDSARSIGLMVNRVAIRWSRAANMPMRS